MKLLGTGSSTCKMCSMKLILTGTALQANKDTTDKIFDTVAKSFKLNP